MTMASISKNTLFNLSGTVIPLMVGAITVPYMLPRLGDERFGILTLLWAIIGYFSLFDLGMGRAVTQQVAVYLSSGRNAEIRGIVRIGVLLTAITGFVGALLLASFAALIARSGLGVSAAFVPETDKCLLAAAVGVPFATISAALRGVLEAYNRFFAVNMAKIGFGVAVFALPALSVSLFGPNLFYATIALVLARLVAALAFWVLTFDLAYRNESFAGFTVRYAWNIFSFGMWMGASNLVGSILIYADRFAIAKLLGAAQVAFYTVPFEFIVRALIIPGALGSSLLPRLSADFVRNHSDARRLLSVSLRIISAVMVALTASVALLARPTMTKFLGPEFTSHAAPVAVILCAGVLFNGIANIPYIALQSLGVAKKTGILHLTELVLYMPALYLCVTKLGVVGAAIAWSLRTFVDAAVLFALLAFELRRSGSRAASQ